MPDIVDYAHHRRPPTGMIAQLKANVPADSVTSRKIGAGKGLVHNHNSRPRAYIVLTESAPFFHGNTDGIEIAGRHCSCVHGLRWFVGVSFHLKPTHALVVIERYSTCCAHRLDPRQPPNLFEQTLIKLASLFWCPVMLIHWKTKRQAGGRKPWVFPGQLQITSDEQSGPDQEDNRYRHLNRHQRLPQPVRCSSNA